MVVAAAAWFAGGRLVRGLSRTERTDEAELREAMFYRKA